MIIAPSILSANFGNLADEIDMLNRSTADWIHVDIMDGVFVPNISFGTPIMNVLKKLSKKPLDVHLMIDKPERYIDFFFELGAHHITVHYESCIHLHRTVNYIRSLGMKAGVALNPHSPISFLEPIIHQIDIICLMSVNPGFGGQQFIEGVYKKISSLKNMLTTHGAKGLIEIDGGVTLENRKDLGDLGADALVVGNTVFSDKSPSDVIEKLKYN